VQPSFENGNVSIVSEGFGYTADEERPTDPADTSEPPRGKLNWTGFANRDDQILIALSIVIGILVGLTVVAFMLITGRLSARMYPPDSQAWRRVLVPVAGSLLSGYLLFRYFPGARGSGIPQTKFAIFLDDGYISLRTVLGKLLCCSISLASGIALGREGPSVQIGAGIASSIARRFGLSAENVRALVPAGAAAALAAAFNTPIAAVLFSLEEILGDLHAPVLGSVVLSSATSWMVLHLILGDQPLFHVPAYQLVSPAELGIYAILGVLGGLGSVCFVKLLLGLRVWFRRMPRWTVWLQPAIGGLVVGLLGWFRPEVLGVGYDYIDRVLSGDFPLKTVILLAVLKLIATPVCYSSGNAGGIFGPSLFVGAMIGGAVGSVAHSLFPASTASPGAYALVGMGTAFAGIVRTPLTSVIMIFEMTRDYSIIVPLMISNMISFFLSQKLQKEPIYEALARQEGVHLPTPEERGGNFGLKAADVMRKDVQLQAPGFDPELLLAEMAGEQCSAWPVGDGSRLHGMAHKAPDTPITSTGYAVAYPDHSLSQMLERMRAHKVDILPVVSRADVNHLYGIVTRRQILAAYGVPENGPTGVRQ
jgi:CIC family chloride channel protein